MNLRRAQTKGKTGILKLNCLAMALDKRRRGEDTHHDWPMTWRIAYNDGNSPGVPVHGARAEIIPLEPERVMPLREAIPFFGPLIPSMPCPAA